MHPIILKKSRPGRRPKHPKTQVKVDTRIFFVLAEFYEHYSGRHAFGANQLLDFKLLMLTYSLTGTRFKKALCHTGRIQ